jgi:hypothetical protein
MAETLGSLVDKLTIVNLKLWHCEEAMAAATVTPEDAQRLAIKQASLTGQRHALQLEINAWFEQLAVNPGGMTLEFPQNKIYGQSRSA